MRSTARFIVGIAGALLMSAHVVCGRHGKPENKCSERGACCFCCIARDCRGHR